MLATLDFALTAEDRSFTSPELRANIDRFLATRARVADRTRFGPAQIGTRSRRQLRGAGGARSVAEGPGEGPGGAEELVEHEDPADVAVERVLGGEPDAGEHLLAVAGDVRAPRPASAFAMAAVWGDWSSQAASSTASAVSMATRVSASRWRTAWNMLIGWPNWMRSRACVASQLEHRPRRADELVADARAGRGRPPSVHPVTGRGSASRRTAPPVTSTRPSQRIDAARPAGA